jgi:hypothetical protein
MYENLSYVNCVNSCNYCLVPVQMRNCTVCVLRVSAVMLILCQYASLIVLWLRYRIVILCLTFLTFCLKYIKKIFQMKVFYCMFSGIYQFFFREKVV